MTPQEIGAIYDQLDHLMIKLEQVAELGTEYLKTKLLECRQKQNTVTDLIVRCNRQYSAARMAVRAQEAACRVAGMSPRGAELRDELSKMLDERDSLKYLLEALSVRRANLGRTSSDIRLMAGIIEQESRPGNASAGQERPTKAPEKPVPTELPSLDVVKIPTMAEFEQGIAQVIEKAKAEGTLPANDSVDEPIIEPQEILAPPVAEPVPVAEPKTEKKDEPKPPAAPTLAADDEIDMDAFLET